MPDQEKVFRLYACCILVKGASRSSIIDTQRNELQLIPQGMHYVLTECKDLSLSEIKEQFDPDQHKVIDEYFNFLADNEFGFWSSTPERFPAIDLTYKAPQAITNAIIDINASSAHNYPKLFRELEALGCQFLEIRFFSRMELEEIEDVVINTNYSRLRGIELFIPYTTKLTVKDLTLLLHKHHRIIGVVLHSCPNELHGTTAMEKTIRFTAQVLDGPQCCGVVHEQYFSFGLEAVSEAVSFNSCLNKKISVDAEGYIKNCPSMQQTYGHANDTSLIEVLNKKGFKDLWDVTKDKVSVCKDCEFRYVCTDCRAYLANSDDRYSKPAKCNYDPYTATWQ